MLHEFLNESVSNPSFNSRKDGSELKSCATFASDSLGTYSLQDLVVLVK